MVVNGRGRQAKVVDPHSGPLKEGGTKKKKYNKN